jgi:hypothetical protein
MASAVFSKQFAQVRGVDDGVAQHHVRTGSRRECGCHRGDGEALVDTVVVGVG